MLALLEGEAVQRGGLRGLAAGRKRLGGRSFSRSTRAWEEGRFFHARL